MTSSETHDEYASADQTAAWVKVFKAKEQRELHLTNLLLMVAVAGIIAGLVYWLFPGNLPLPEHLFWTGRPVAELLLSSWPLLAWGVVLTLAVSALVKHTRADQLAANQVDGHHMILSLQAGILEEVMYRFLVFTALIGIIPLANWLLFGWNGGGMVHWLFTVAFIPVTNWLTFGNMTSFLVTTPWYVGAAVVWANHMFSRGRVSKGSFAVINTWFVGIFCFWIMFEYGLLGAIAVHFLYARSCIPSIVSMSHGTTATQKRQGEKVEQELTPP